ncbi:MAG: hypothetical protein KF809_10820 [Chloroflexi bacterium]|nr:hypothetical protein [Chloroflexota bacterium]
MRVSGSLALALLVVGLPTHGVAASPSVAASGSTATSAACATVSRPDVVDAGPPAAATPGALVAPSDAGPVGTAHMVRDIDPTGSGAPMHLTPFKGGVVFSARDDAHGRELWFATASGAKRLKDIRPGAASSKPDHLTVVGGTLYFSAHDGPRGRELWKTDGTAAGTRLVRDIRPGSKGSRPDTLTAFKGKVFFAAHDGAHGREQWKSDGTKSGTKLVKDLTPGSSQFVVDYGVPTPWVVFKGRLYFGAQTPRGGLWRTDGTAAGTKRILKNVFPRNLLATSKRLFFVGISPVGCGMEEFLWRSDGTTAGTKPVASHWIFDEVVTLGGRAYFIVGTGNKRRLYRNAGTWLANGAVKPKVAVDDSTGLQVVGGRLFLSQDGGLAISDGTGAGTIPLGDTGSAFRGRVDVVKVGDRWYFPGGFGSHGSDLWQTDGTVQGTTLAAAVDLTGSHDLRTLVRSGGAIWFSADDGTHGRELWRYVP